MVAVYHVIIIQPQPNPHYSYFLAHRLSLVAENCHLKDWIGDESSFHYPWLQVHPHDPRPPTPHHRFETTKHDSPPKNPTSDARLGWHILQWHSWIANLSFTLPRPPGKKANKHWCRQSVGDERGVLWCRGIGCNPLGEQFVFNSHVIILFPVRQLPDFMNKLCSTITHFRGLSIGWANTASHGQYAGSFTFVRP